jgi:hypothetical protein
MPKSRGRRKKPKETVFKLSEDKIDKRRDAPYRSGRRSEWVKVKTENWQRDNRERWRLFDRRR